LTWSLHAVNAVMASCYVTAVTLCCTVENMHCRYFILFYSVDIMTCSHVLQKLYFHNEVIFFVTKLLHFYIGHIATF